MEFPEVEHYKIVEKISEGGMGIVYQAIDTKSEDVVAIKTLKESVDKDSEIFLRFKREAELLSKLEHENVLKFIDFIESETKLYIVTEYVIGENLKILINSDNLSIEDKVRYIYEIARAFDYVHSQGIIHRDIKPSNIIITEDNRPKILDFGVANLINFHKLFASKQGIAGSFAYMSPEQSGILKRNIDVRSDLYSLGILFYHLITTEVPYKSKHVGELLHQHIAQIPEEPKNIIAGLSPIINKIILKLIRKDPDDRYQSAYGLAEDLKIFLGLNENQKQTFYLELGKKDRLKNLNYRTSQFGRKKETKILINKLNNTVLGHGAVCVVLGKSGIGKTRLINELPKYVRGKNGIFIPINSVEENSSYPYYPFIQAAKNIVEMLRKLPENLTEEIKNNAVEVLGEEGVILSKVIKPLSAIVGEYKDNVEFSKSENDLFFQKLKDFFIAISSPRHPLVISFDDVHFWDKGSIQFFQYFLNFIDANSVFLVLSIREDETHRVKDLYNTITKEAKAGNISIVNLYELNCDDVLDLINEIFGTLSLGGKELAARLHESTQGNPLLIIENIKTLVEEEIITQKEEGWSINLEKLSKFRFSSSIIDKILSHFTKIDSKTKEMLSYAAILGKIFHFNILFSLIREFDSEITREELLEYLKESIKNSLLAETLSENGEIIYSFVHDKIIETLLSQMTFKKIKDIHYAAARVIEQKYNEVDRLYKLAYHYLKSEVKDKAYIYNVKAGRKALNNFSFKLAVGFFTDALDIVKKYGAEAEKNIRIRIDLTMEIVELKLQLSEFRENIHLLEDILPFVEKLNDKEIEARTYFYLGKNYYLCGDQITSLVYYNKVIPIAEELDLDELLVLPYCAIGRVNIFLLYFKESIEYLEKGLKLFQPFEELDEFSRLERLYSLGVLIQAYGYLGKKNEALRVMKTLQNDYGNFNKEIYQMYIDFYCSSGHGLIGDSEKGLEEGFRCIEKAKEFKNSIIETFGYNAVGASYLSKQNFIEAIRNISKSIKMAKENFFLVALALLYLHLAEAYAYIGNSRIALENLEEVEKVKGKSNPVFIEQFNQRVKAICEINSTTPDLDTAMNFINKAIKASDELGESYIYHKAHNFIIKAAVYWKADDNENADLFYTKGISIYKELNMIQDFNMAEYIKDKFSFAPSKLESTSSFLEKEKSTSGHSSTYTQTEFSYQRQLQYLIKLSEKLARYHDMNELLPAIMSLAIEVSGAERGIVFLFDDPLSPERKLEIMAQTSIDPKEEKKTMTYSKKIVEETLVNEKGQLILDAEKELNDDTSVHEFQMKSIITLPLIVSDKMLGIIYLDNRQVKGLFTEDNFELLKAFAIEAAISIENAKLYKQIEETARIEHEMEIARDIQTSILPVVDNIDGYEIVTFMKTASEVGGDYFDFFFEDSPYFGVFGDVSGHGIRSGIIMMMAEVAFNTLMTDLEMRKKSLEEIYQIINIILYKNIQERLAKKSNHGVQYNHMYMTFNIFRFDENGDFEMYGNDHARPFICRKDSDEIKIIPSSGFFIGVLKNSKFRGQVQKFNIKSGDILCLYSDGITEAKRRSSKDNGTSKVREMFGEERLYEIVKNNKNEDLNTITEIILNELESWMDVQEDDVTLVLIRKK